ncbi:uncharacterized protein [Argopecten irradians]|uniref:uncharacterized protein n=1 Tax=Argopecten irradians TaxID=31199 RepID=UPI003717D59D
MKTFGLWLLLLVLMVILTAEADAKKRRRRIKFSIRVTFRRRNRARGRRDIEEMLTLPCDVRDYDTNKDDVISRMEWQRYITEFNPELDFTEYEDVIIEQLDTNGDGVLQVEEFFVDTRYKKDCI